MSEYREAVSGEEEGSDGRTDTGEESFRSHGTPNSILSSDFDDKSMETAAPPHPENADNKLLRKMKHDDLSDSLVSRMCNLNLDSPKLEDRPTDLDIGPPRLSSTLVLTTSHPLMGSPDNFPDVVPAAGLRALRDEDVDNSLSSAEDDKPNGNYCDTSDSDIYRNNSKNNLYFSDHFTTTDSHSQILDSQHNSLPPPDIARIGRRKLVVPKFMDQKEIVINQNRTLPLNRSERDENIEFLKVEERGNTQRGQSTPNVDSSVVSMEGSEYFSALSEAPPGPARPRRLPLRPPAARPADSPESPRSPEELSQYEARADPVRGCVSLRARRQTADRGLPALYTPRRKIVVPDDDDDACSDDSVGGSLGDEEEEPPSPPRAHPGGALPAARPPLQGYRDRRHSASDDDTTKRSSKSERTCSSDSSLIPEYSLAEERRDERGWVTVAKGGARRVCDMRVIEPFKRVLSHGGYSACGAALIVVAACHLPDTSRPDYAYVMEHLFLYVMWTLDRLVTEEYILVYLHGSAGPRRLPSVRWLRDCYTLVDRRLRKSLQHLYLVHPTFWLRCFVVATKPFVSSKFFRKLSYVNSLSALEAALPTLSPHAVPDLVRRYDAARGS